MTGSAQRIAGHSVYILDSDGPAIGSERDATDLISEAAGTDAQMIAIPTARLDPSFLDPNDDLLQRQLASCFFLYPDPGPQKRNPRFANGSCKDIFWLNAGFFIFFKIVPQFKPEFVNFV